MELAGQQTIEGIILEPERVQKIDQRPPRNLDDRIDFLAVVFTRESERKTSLRIDPGSLFFNHAVFDVDAAVFDNQIAAAVPPHDIPRAHPVADEVSLDSRIRE